MRLFGIWTVLVALSISVVAAYYSIVGLVAIFAAAFTPIVIMGAVLEVGKLTTAVWLHTYWNNAQWAMKTYLSFALVMLMFITSMGIFGFLSKAHIEQTAQATEGTAQLERIEGEISRNEDIISRAEQKILKLESADETADDGIQEKINQEQKRIDTAYDRVQPAIDATRKQLESDRQFYLNQLSEVDDKIAKLDAMADIDTSDTESVKRLQTLVGTRPDGAYGGGTARAVKSYKEGLQSNKTEILAKIEELKANASEEISRLRSRAETEIDDSNKLISRLRSQLGTGVAEDVTDDIAEQREKIRSADTQLEVLFEEKFAIEKTNRALEAEVGPVKYIAELVYGPDADKNTLEEAVRWVIIILVLVFDPLAVVLVIAGITLLERDHARRQEQISEIALTPEQALDELVRHGEEHNLYETTAESNPLVKESEEPEEWYEENERIDIIGQNGNDGLHYEDIADELEHVVEEIQEIKKEINDQIDPADRNYHIQQEQIELNNIARERREQEAKTKIEQVVSRMKEEGRWPNPPAPTERVALDAILSADESGELTELLEKADENTLKEVYSQLIDEVNNKKS